MSELTNCYEAARVGTWMHPEASRCGCKGKGWFLSEVDTWHSCGFHFDGQLHPEGGDDYFEPVEDLSWDPCVGDIPF